MFYANLSFDVRPVVEEPRKISRGDGFTANQRLTFLGNRAPKLPTLVFANHAKVEAISRLAAVMGFNLF